MTTRSRSVQTRDGLVLAVQEHGDPADKTVVLVHGYPDDHTVWDGLVELLAPSFHVVTYDVRGAGASEAPPSREGYRIGHLVEDLVTVVDAVVPGKRVHLLAHDWGSIQAWAAVADPAHERRFLSFTSISGPSLDMAAAWLRRVKDHPLATLRQLADSYYIFAFQLPVLPELLVQRGVLARLVAHSQKQGPARPTHRRIDERTARNGIELYRANFLGKMATPHLREVTVPVQVLAPEHDVHVSSALQRQAPEPWCRHLLTHDIPGNHWVVEQDPGLIAARFTDFVGYAESFSA